MSYRWLSFLVGAGVLGGAAWYFGRPHKQETPPVEVIHAVEPEAQSKDKPAPPRLLEVIDLTSAYDPVREPTPTPGVDPASFIEVQTAPKRIPYSVTLDDKYEKMRSKLKGTPFEAFIPAVRPERIPIAPREVREVLPAGHLLHVPTEPWTSGLLRGENRQLPADLTSFSHPWDSDESLPDPLRPESGYIAPWWQESPQPFGVLQPIPNVMVRTRRSLIDQIPVGSSERPIKKLDIMPREVK